MEDWNEKIIDYSIDKIYNIFNKYCYKSNILDIPDNLNDFLEQESIILDDEQIESLDKNFIQKIKNVLDENECVFIKLNWSSADDSHFLNQGLKCYTIKDVLRLMKGSTKLFNDLNLLKTLLNQEKKIKSILVLYKWYSLDCKSEFRCLIVDSNLKAICQRNTSHYYNFEQSEIDEYTQLIQNFFNYLNDDDSIYKFFIEKKFIVIDVYVTKKKKVKIIDVAGYYKDLLLINDWDEIKYLNKVLFKCIMKHEESCIPKYLTNKVPIEAFEYGGLDKLLEFINSEKLNKEEYEMQE